MDDIQNSNHQQNWLPIDRHIEEIQKAIEQFSATILIAPTGAGKSTRLPAKLRSKDRIVIVQPRRAAARLVANRIAENAGEKVGGKVGYHIRFEKRFGPESKIIVLTEGMLLRWLQSNPFLDDISLIVLDEFHERSVNMDLCLGLIRDIQSEMRTDLKLLIMSATLDPAPLKKWLGKTTPIIVSKGRTHPVEIIYDKQQDDRPLAIKCNSAISSALKNTSGDILVFLPGAKEIQSVLESVQQSSDIALFPLHGRLSLADQQAAMSSSGARKVILATNIAETSITLPRVDSVIDSGLQRQAMGQSGFQHLQTKRISLDAADQRAGRAGRLRPGRCRRLWTQHAETSMSKQRMPEIKRANLTQTALHLLCWGVHPHQFNWLEAPPQKALNTAMNTLKELGAIENNQLTTVGRIMAELPCEPALARLLIEADTNSCLFEAAGIAAILSDGFWNSKTDMLSWLDHLDRDHQGKRCRNIRRQLLNTFPKRKGKKTPDYALEKALITAFPNRVGCKRDTDNRYLMADGSEAWAAKGSQSGKWIVAPSMGQVDKGMRRIRGSVDISPEWLSPTDIETHQMVGRKIVCERQSRWGALIVNTVQIKPNPAKASELLHSEVLKNPDKAFQMSQEAKALKARITWLARVKSDFEFNMPTHWNTLLAESCLGKRSFDELKEIDMHAALWQSLTWEQKKTIDAFAPAHFQLPTGRKTAIHYSKENPPRIEARIQQLFGMNRNPTLCGQPIQIALLAPNNRPQQVTIDMLSFWKDTYPLIRKELRGRYPKHAWPENPTAKDAEDRPKRRYKGEGKKTK